MNSRVHSFKLGFRTSSRKVTNKPHGCGRLATSRSSRTLEEEEAKKMSLYFRCHSYRTICSCRASELASANKYKIV